MAALSSIPVALRQTLRRRSGRPRTLVIAVLAAMTLIVAQPAHAAESPTPAVWGGAELPSHLEGIGGQGIAAGLGHYLLLGTDGGVVAWGDSALGQADVPPSNAKVTQVAAGANHSLALDSTGAVTAWGNNSFGQSSVPKQDKQILQIAAGGSNSLAIAKDGSLIAWGDNGFGQNNIPSELTGKVVTAIAVGSGFSLALTRDGGVTAWGRSDVGQLELPADLSAGKKAVQIAAGIDQSLAVLEDGAVVAWGGNAFGQVNIARAGSSIARVVAGPYLSGTITQDGELAVLGKDDARIGAAPTGATIAAAVASETTVLALVGAVPSAGGSAGGPGNTVESLAGPAPDEGGTPGEGGTTGTGGVPGAGMSEPGQVALTGFQGALILGIALAALVGGSLLVIAARRKRLATDLPQASSSSRNAARLATTTLAILALSATGLVVTTDDASAAENFPTPGLAELVDNDFVLYFANAGTANPDAVSSGDHMGFYQARTDQAYGVDATTGAKWGYVEGATSKTAANTSTGTDKTASVRYDVPPAGADLATREVAYDFDVPAGEYDVSFGFSLPSGWTSRDVDLIAEGALLGQVKAPSLSLLEKTYSSITVTDGTLNVQVHSPEGRTNTYTDPAVNYITIRAVKSYTRELLAERIRTVTLDAAQEGAYTTDSVDDLSKQIAIAQALVDAGSTDAVAIRKAYDALGAAYAALRPLVRYESFTPGAAWLDDRGNPIQAHGGQVVAAKDADGKQIYYWYGEDRWNGYGSSPGVHVYSSYDLYNWKDEGLALRSMSDADQFTTDPFFAELYADYTAEQRADVFHDLGTVQHDPNVNAAILERPKVVYNESTGQWVLWVHSDGPSATSNAQYAKANAGVAVSDSPTGPFRYIDSYRLNVAPDGEVNYMPDSPGMARDMNLFVDTDDTGYIIYASEENATLFISKLADNYMYLSAPVDRAVKGEDFTRTYIGGNREAPAVFLYDGSYYLITSGATGWSPNPAKYATSDSMLGEWTDHGNPVTGPGLDTTHGSQSTSVIAVDPAAGKYIYMGDRWTPDDLRNATAVWLPIEFGDDGSLALNWHAEWTLEDLEGKGKVNVETDFPETVWLGDGSTLPTTGKVTIDGVTSKRSIQWDTSALSTPGPVTVAGTVEGISRKIHRDVLVVPRGLAYFVDAGMESSADYETIRAKALTNSPLLNSGFDQGLASDPDTGATWGAVGTETDATAGTLYGSLRYVTSTASNRSLSYSFDSLSAGEYNIFVGLYDPWSQWANNRRATISVNGTQVVAAQPITGTPTVATLPNQNVGGDGKLELSLTPVGTGEGTDAQLSWIMIVRK